VRSSRPRNRIASGPYYFGDSAVLRSSTREITYYAFVRMLPTWLFSNQHLSKSRMNTGFHRQANSLRVLKFSKANCLREHVNYNLVSAS
jgi:hypothetical protein